MTLPDRDESEHRRLQRLRALMVLDTEHEPMFDSLAALASSLCGTPIALISLIDSDRQWFKANVGLPGVHETPREVAFCDHAIRADTVLEVSDATTDARFADNPLVTGTPDIRFYAGAPLLMSSGERIGTLCVIDRQPRQLTPSQREALGHVARLTVQALEMRERSIHQSLAVRNEHERAVADSERRFRAILDAQSELVSQATADGTLVYVNPAYAAFFGRKVADLIGSSLYAHVLPDDRALVTRQVAQVLDQGHVATSENRMQSPAGEERWVSWTNTRQQADDGTLLLHSTGRDVTATVRVQRALAHSEALLDRTGRAAGVGGWELDIRRGKVTWTAETRRIHEVPPDFQPTLERALDFYSPAARPIVAAAVQRGLAEGTGWELELELVTARGRTIWVRAIGEVEFDDGRPVRMFGAFQDISERRAAELAREKIAAELIASQAERERQARTLRSVTDAIPSTVAVVDRRGRYVMANPAFERALGLSADQIIGRKARDVLGDSEFRARWPWVQRVLAGESVRFEREQLSAGSLRNIGLEYVPLRAADGEVDGFVAIGQDITRAKQEHDRLHALSRTDMLTMLLNRVGFEQRLQAHFAPLATEPVALVYCDLDHFKDVNDTHGHAAGDELLKLVARRLVRLVRPSDGIARLGGDEFALVLPGLRHAADALRVGESIVTALAQPFQLAGDVEARIGCSVGIALGATGAINAADLLARADRMLYDAKRQGRGRVALMPPDA